MPFSEEMRQLLTANNFQFLFNGLKLTLYISFVSIILSTIFGTILAVFRNKTSSHSQCFTSDRFSVCYCHQGYKFLVFRNCFTRTLWQILYLNGALRTNRTSIHYLRNRRPNLFHY